MVWPEIEQASKNHRYELILSGEKINKRLQTEQSLDPNLWTLTQLNFLEISSCSSLEQISDEIQRLIHLSTLTLTSNRLNEIPSAIQHLEHLRHLNFSNNQLKNLPMDLFVHLIQLETLNLSHNLLEELPAFSGTGYPKLAIVNLSNNRLKTLPDLSSDMENVSSIDLSGNQFEIFPPSIFHLHSLKILLIDSNQLNEIPSQLSQLHKLKDLRFKSNPIKDNRLKKLMEQDKIKAVLEYLTKQWNELQKSTPKSTEDKTQKSNEDEDDQQEQQNQMQILHFDQPGDLKGRQITLLPGVANVRPHILCCIVRNLDLSTPGNLKKFLNLQNELHDGICQKRTSATIATHDLSAISGDLVYDARDPDQIGLIPLGKGPKLISAREFYDQLWKDAEHERKLKKRNQLSGLHKYLTLLENEKDFPCLSDSNRFVISLPPLTNSDRTKLSSTSESILIEITSGTSMDICRRVMDSLLIGMFEIQLGKKNNDQQMLIVQQTRVVDEKGQLKTTFPSRTDLHCEHFREKNIFIQRLTIDK